MSDDRSPRSGADRQGSADVALSAITAVAAAIHDFGPGVLTRAPDPDADRDAEIGRHILQAVDSKLGKPGSLRENVERLAADPRDDAALATLQHTIQHATASDPSLLAQVETASRSDDPVTEDSGIPPRSAPTE